MPVYEYVCDRCGSRFSLLQPMSAAREGHPCPECGATQTRRVVSSFAAQGGSDGGGACGPSGGRFR